jgi:hypothetical protein
MVSHNLAVVAHLCDAHRRNAGRPDWSSTLSVPTTCAPAASKHPHTEALRELSVELEEPEGVV